MKTQDPVVEGYARYNQTWLTGEQWTSDQVKAWTAQMRTSLTNPKHHAYHMMYALLSNYVFVLEWQN